MEGRRCIAEVLAGIGEDIHYCEQGLHWAKNNPHMNYKLRLQVRAVLACHSWHDAEQTTNMWI